MAVATTSRRAAKKHPRKVGVMVYVTEAVMSIIDLQCDVLGESRSNYFWRLVLKDQIDRGFLTEDDLS